MSEGQKTIITSLTGILPKHTYNVNTDWDNCSVNLSAQTLLDIAYYAQAHLAILMEEADEDAETYHFQLQETVEMCPVKEEWCYKTSDLLLSPLPIGGKSADEDAESSQSARLVDVDQVNLEWRYRTSDLLLSPPPTGGASADEDAEPGQSARLVGVDQDNPEWRYRTSDLRL